MTSLHYFITNLIGKNKQFEIEKEEIIEPKTMWFREELWEERGVKGKMMLSFRFFTDIHSRAYYKTYQVGRIVTFLSRSVRNLKKRFIDCLANGGPGFPKRGQFFLYCEIDLSGGDHRQFIKRLPMLFSMIDCSFFKTRVAPKFSYEIRLVLGSNC